MLSLTTTRSCREQRKSAVLFKVSPPIPYGVNISEAYEDVYKKLFPIQSCPPLSKILSQSFTTVVNWVMSFSKSIFHIRYYVVLDEPHDSGVNKMFQKFAEYAYEGNMKIVIYTRPIAHLKHRAYIC